MCASFASSMAVLTGLCCRIRASVLTEEHHPTSFGKHLLASSSFFHESTNNFLVSSNLILTTKNNNDARS